MSNSNTNEDLLINSILDESHQQIGEDLGQDRFFARWAFEQVLKEYDPSFEELELGDVGDGNDGGIDGVFAFLDGSPVVEPLDAQEHRKSPNLDLVIIQAKNQRSFKESVFDKLAMSLRQLLSLERSSDDMTTDFSTPLLERRDLFKDAFVGLATKHPKLRVRIVYASRGITADIHPKVRNKAATTQAVVAEKFPGAEIDVQFYGAKELLARAAKKPSYTSGLRYTEELSGQRGDAYVLLSRLDDFIAFVSTENNELSRHLFDSNVRDYQGEVEVNKEIARTVQHTDDPLDFWWLNNGVTILASKASRSKRQMMLDDVQIVNGLQTTETLFRHSAARSQGNDRSILVKVIVTTDEAARDRIIKATNFQTKIPDSSLRATDQVQRNIETFFRSHDIYYDRRKNYYKHQRVARRKIVSIGLLAQAHAACVKREPHVARGKPSSLVKTDAAYNAIFSEATPIELYLRCIQLLRTADQSLTGLPVELRSNLRFHCAMLLACELSGTKSYTSDQLLKIDTSALSTVRQQAIVAWLSEQAQSQQANRGGSMNKVSKSAEFVRTIMESFEPRESIPTQTTNTESRSLVSQLPATETEAITEQDATVRCVPTETP